MIIPYKYFSRNGEILPIEQATISLSNVEYSYGFGVYETVRTGKGQINFGPEHSQRLMESARLINLEHPFSAEFMEQSMTELVAKMEVATANLKVLLIGAPTPEQATLYILCLNPLFPDRKLYREGAHCITQPYERPIPHAKTLNMLQSYLAYRAAKQAGAYDALAINRDGCIVEGTRTNFFVIKDKTITSPPEADILLGVTRDKVLQTARQQGFEITEQAIPLENVNQYDGAFLTSTSTKIMPIRSIDEYRWEAISPALQALMQAFN